MLRSSVSLDLDVASTASERGAKNARAEAMRQRPVSQMFHAKSLEQFLSGGDELPSPSPPSPTAGPLARSPRADECATSRRRERWSLRPGRDLFRSLSGSHPPSSFAAASSASPDDGKKRSNGFKIGRVFGDMGKGMSNAMASIPITPRGGAQKERERLLEQGARQAEQAGTTLSEDTAKWDRRKRAATTTKGKMGALLHSFSSPGDGISRHIRKRSVSGKIREEEKDNEESNEGKGSGRINRAKSVSDLHKVSKSAIATSPIKKRNSTFSNIKESDVIRHDLSVPPTTSSDGDDHDDETSRLGGDGPTDSIFGATLEEIMSFQKETVELDVPLVLVALTTALVKLGTENEGIFRVPGTKLRIDQIKSRIVEGDYEFDDQQMSVHDLASTLKEWLQSLKEPVVPASFYEKCISSASRPKDCVAVVEELPSLNRNVLQYIVSFLQTHVLRPDIQKVTRMDIKSIATTFAPCLMRSPEVKDMQVMMANIQQEIKFMVNLLMLMNSAVIGEAPV